MGLPEELTEEEKAEEARKAEERAAEEARKRLPVKPALGNFIFFKFNLLHIFNGSVLKQINLLLCFPSSIRIHILVP